MPEAAAAPGDLPFIDRHTRTVALGSSDLWAVLRRNVGHLGFGPDGLGPRLLGTVPPEGFAVVAEIPGRRVVLEGRHRFSRYRLVLEIESRPAQRTTLLHATTYAEFPGVHGRVYRLLVIGSGLHVVATRRLLRQLISTTS